MTEEYKLENIRLIKSYFKELSEFDYSNLTLIEAIGLEHDIFYKVYDKIKKEFIEGETK